MKEIPPLKLYQDRLAKLETLRGLFGEDEIIQITRQELEQVITSAEFSRRATKERVSITLADVEGLISRCKKSIEAAQPFKYPPPLSLRP